MYPEVRPRPKFKFCRLWAKEYFLKPSAMYPRGRVQCPIYRDSGTLSTGTRYPEVKVIIGLTTALTSGFRDSTETKRIKYVNTYMY